MTTAWWRTICSLLLALGVMSPSIAEDDEAQAAKQSFLGVRPAQEDAAQAFEAQEGILIDHIVLGSTADAAGLEPGDRLLRIDAHSIKDSSTLHRVVRDIAVGSELTLTIMRKGEELAQHATMQGYPSAHIWDEAIRAEETRRQQQREELREASQNLRNKRWRNHALAGTMLKVAESLENIPPHIATAATEFQKVYPEGTFDITFTIRIASHDEPTTAHDVAESDSDPDADADAEPDRPTDEDSTPSESDDATAQDAVPEATEEEPNDAALPIDHRDPTPLRGMRRRDGPKALDRFQAETARSGTPVLLAALSSLSEALEALPARLQEAANAFHQVYPKGVFQISVQVQIEPDPNSENVLRLGPAQQDDDAEEQDLSADPDDAGDADESDGSDELEDSQDDSAPVE